VRWFSADVFFFEDDFSVARVEQSGDGAQRGCFAGAVGRN
jgi:hypothetical protein